MQEPDLGAAAARVVAFLGEQDLGRRLSDLESQLNGADADMARRVATDAKVDRELLHASLLVARRLGKQYDLIHAAAITLALPHLLESGERIVNRPSLGAGNDPTRKFDIETDRRVAEFKLSRWSGGDAQRQRGAFKDVATLTLDGDDRRRQLYVVGPEPVRWLFSTSATVNWALDGARQQLRQRFFERFPEHLSVPEFIDRSGVEILDLEQTVPEVFAVQHGATSPPSPVSTRPVPPRAPAEAGSDSSVGQLRDELARYEAELRAAGLRDNTVHTYVDRAERFVRWLEGRWQPRSE